MEIPFADKFLFEVWRIVRDYFVFASGAFFIFYVVFREPMWFRKIQQKMPTLRDYRRDFLFSMLSVVITAIVLVVTFYVMHEHHNVYTDISDFSIAYYMFTFVWMFFLHDTWFYWMHRAMHSPMLFKRVHLIHHKSTNPSPWTAYAFHPLEALLEASILPLIAFTLPVHTSAVIFFFLFQIIYNVYGHLGFELLPKDFHKNWFGKWLNTSTAHNLHHHKFRGNYGLYTLIWDRLLGTVREDYDSTYERTTSRPREVVLQSE